MRKIVLVLSLAMILMASGLAAVQDQPKPKKDTVNIDTDAKPTFYYAEEDEAAESKGNTSTIAIIAGVVLILGAGFFFVLRKKK
jgi:LPXTG-motif cell wall-anchored protein